MKRLLPLTYALLSTLGVMAQDAQLTQYFAGPGMLNPAMTGLIMQDIRVSSVYRSQWSQVTPNPYNTASLTVDAPILKGVLPKGDALGIGLQAFYDRDGTRTIVNKNFGASLSYHKALGKDSSAHLSLGVQAMLIGKRVDLNWATFQVPDRYVSISYADYAAGAMYSRGVGQRASVYVGYALYHIAEPVEVYANADSATIRMRHMIHAGGSLALGKNTALYLNCLYQKQAHNDVAIGSYLGFALSGKKHTVAPPTLYVGGWYRYQDAIAPYVGIEWAAVRIGLSYDVNISSFAPATRSQGAYELSLIYRGRIKKDRKNNGWYCSGLY